MENSFVLMNCECSANFHTRYERLTANCEELMIAIVWEFRNRERIILVSRRQAAPKAVMGLWATCRRLRKKEIKERRKD